MTQIRNNEEICVEDKYWGSTSGHAQQRNTENLGKFSFFSLSRIFLLIWLMLPAYITI